MTGTEMYFNELEKIFSQVTSTQAEAIERAAQACSEALKNGKLIYTFGTGHSHILAEELFFRAGGLAAVYPVFDDPLMLTHASRSSYMERLSGYAVLLLDEARPIPGSVMFIFSNSGRNSVSVEMAEEAHKRGLTVICITNMKHTRHTSSRHPSGRKLYELCDIVIDNCGCIGDASVEIYGRRSGATSTVIGAAILQAITCRTVELCGGQAEVFCSANLDEGKQINEQYINKDKSLIKPL